MTTVWRSCERFSAGLSLESEELALLRPGVRQIAHPPHPSGGQFDRLAPFENRLDNVWSEKKDTVASGLGYWMACLVNFDRERDIALGSAP